MSAEELRVQEEMIYLVVENANASKAEIGRLFNDACQSDESLGEPPLQRPPSASREDNDDRQ
jgi:hypothetical protein